MSAVDLSTAYGPLQMAGGPPRTSSVMYPPQYGPNYPPTQPTNNVNFPGLLQGGPEREMDTIMDQWKDSFTAAPIPDDMPVLQQNRNLEASKRNRSTSLSNVILLIVIGVLFLLLVDAFLKMRGANSGVSGGLF